MSGDRSNIQLVGNTTQGQNLGTGEGSVFKQKILSNTLQFRSLKEGANIKIIQNGDEITISGASGGGGGDVNSVNTGLGLSGDTTTGDVTIRLDNTAVTPATYGNATCVAQFTVDQQGRITSATNVEITGSGGATTFTGLTDTPANYTGSANCYVRVNAGADALIFSPPPTAAAGGTDGQVQYNNNGELGGSGLCWDNSTNGYSWSGDSYSYNHIRIYNPKFYGQLKPSYLQISGEEEDPFAPVQISERTIFDLFNNTNGEIMMDLTARETSEWGPGIGDALTGRSFITHDLGSLFIGKTAGDNDNILEFTTFEGTLNPDNFISIRSSGRIVLRPNKSVEIETVLNLQSRSTYPSSPNEGDMIRLKNHGVDDDGLYVYNGSAWVDIITW